MGLHAETPQPISYSGGSGTRWLPTTFLQEWCWGTRARSKASGKASNIPSEGERSQGQSAVKQMADITRWSHPSPTRGKKVILQWRHATHCPSQWSVTIKVRSRPDRMCLGCDAKGMAFFQKSISLDSSREKHQTNLNWDILQNTAQNHQHPQKQVWGTVTAKRTLRRHGD